jgi:hypothetical protein
MLKEWFFLTEHLFIQIISYSRVIHLVNAVDGLRDVLLGIVKFLDIVESLKPWSHCVHELEMFVEALFNDLMVFLYSLVLKLFKVNVCKVI